MQLIGVVSGVLKPVSLLIRLLMILNLQTAFIIFQHSDSFSMDWIKNINQFSLLTKPAAVDSDIDPDKNFLKTNCKHSAYFLESEFNKFIMEKNICNSNFSCLHDNIRSLNANIDKLQLLTAGLMHSFSVICVTET